MEEKGFDPGMKKMMEGQGGFMLPMMER